MDFPNQIEQVVIEILQNTYETMGGIQPVISSDTKILGENSSLTSVTFVVFLLDLEKKLGNITGEHIVLTEHPEVFEPNGPFSSVETLVEHISSTYSAE